MVYNVRTVEELYKLKGRIEQEVLDWEELSVDCFETEYISREKDGDGLYIVESKEEFELLLQKHENIRLENAADVGESEKFAEVVYQINEKTPLWIVCPMYVLPLRAYKLLLKIRLRKRSFEITEEESPF